MPSTRPRTLLSRGTDVATRNRSWPAYVLAVLMPGVGHVYAGHWRRGLVWAVLCVAALAFLSTGAILVERTAAEPFLVTALRLEHAGFADVAFPLAVLVLSVVDLYGLGGLEDAAVDAPLANRTRS
jgi:ABC-type antimicrobial peptide transport system permease subunit